MAHKLSPDQIKEHYSNLFTRLTTKDQQTKQRVSQQRAARKDAEL